ncbi:hypothetical protein BDP27DRAFT_1434920 [Rhodocollybia butyracea]|uniref:Myb-like domain-containing protein n=1 Tax=Rhodocollybia butyracea TaxID=206335 RepID=A0A9P5P508_9AGAR|nr:hypothetical protein BDP27DRAFT_1434920 [Rhodocollybia butyracea]
MTNASWTEADEAKLVNYVWDHRAELGDGGNLVKSIANGAAIELAKSPPTKGGPKTAGSCTMKWKKLKKLCEAIAAVKSHTYVGASGWNYDDKPGFSVNPSNADTWVTFVAAHPIFAPFANKGWPHYEKMSEMVPKIARGLHVINIASSQFTTAASQSSIQPSQSFDFEDEDLQVPQRIEGPASPQGDSDVMGDSQVSQPEMSQVPSNDKEHAQPVTSP